jgi:anti-anti-sigma regulatory factor
MASNFQFFSYPTRDSLHLELSGDFDGSSAKELINTLAECGSNFFQIFIDTNNLKTIHPFGRKVFLKGFSTISKQAGNFIFIGKHKQNIDPQSNNFDDYF